MATDPADAVPGTGPSLFEACEEVLGLFTGLVVGALPFVLLSAPALVPLAVLGGIVVAVLTVVLAVLTAVVLMPLLLVRRLSRRARASGDC